MKLFTIAACPAAVDLWCALDLVVRRYEIGELVAFEHYGKAQRRMRQYVDAVAVRP